MTERRKYVQQLPGIVQTQYREKQFAATVDQVFQPGNIEALTGYLGRKPPYYDSVTDLYLGEPTPERQQHQLEPAMVSRDSSGSVTDLLTYDDLINYLEQNNGVVDNHDRMFRNNYYTWAPPVDLDKLNNHTSYFWFGDNPDLLPCLTLTSPCSTYISDGSTSRFSIPPRSGEADASRDSIRVLVGGQISHRWYQKDESSIEFSLVPDSGVRIDVYRYGDFLTLLSGLVTFDPSPYNTQGVTSLTSNMRVRLMDASTEGRSYWVEGVGTSLSFVPFESQPSAASVAPNYSTIDRRSQDRNAWSRANYWVHKNAFDWSGADFSQRIASRPIVEFIADLELFNYGKTRIEATVNCKVSGNPLFGPGIFARPLNQLVTDYEYSAWDVEPYQSSAIVEIPVADINKGLVGSIYVDTQHVLSFGDSLLVVNNPNPVYNNCILQIDKITDPSSGRDSFAAVVTHTPQQGDLVQMPVQGLIAWDEVSEGFDTAPLDFNPGPVELYFDGISWIQAQNFVKGVAPVFNLYDADGQQVSDASFAGSRVFGYSDGDGPVDSVLGRALLYDGSGNVLFENFLQTVRAGPGFQWYKVADPSGSYLGNGWLKGAGTTSQTVEDQVWTIPRNLSANPTGNDISRISKPDWFDQFSGIVAAQQGCVGLPYALNNYRDTAKDCSLGSRIVQNENPLLRTMLLASDPRFDLFASNNFVEREYARFRRKFFQQISVCYENGTCRTEQPGLEWVSTILALMRVAKAADGPFCGSTMAGANYFVPPTPSFLGLLPSVAPEIVLDTTYSTPIFVVVGHDGSRVPCTGDYRDSIMLALETAIYNSIPEGLGTPSFDLKRFVSGFARSAGDRYSQADLTTMLSPYLIRWAQINGFDISSNGSYVASDPFTYNYRGVKDVFGNTLLGNWRAIYRYFFDTDSPHARPWEMLGFASKPQWFDHQYGPAPYTSGNRLLWDDLRDGVVRDGSRAGIDPDYARPNLYSILPVDEGGNLLDPIAAKIASRSPSGSGAAANWQIGDGGPVENLWINSPSYAFALAGIAFLMRPAEWIETCWDTQAHVIKNGQKLFASTMDRSQKPTLVHGEIDDGVRVVRFGIQQWVSDYLRSRGAAPALVGSALRGVTVQLAHKMAGFTQKNNLRVRSDTFGILPAEDVEIVFYEPAPFRRSTYSNIIIEWVETGWSVVGYDNLNNYFPTLVGDPTGPTTSISLGKNPIVYEWRTGVSYPVGRLVDYRGTFYSCAIAHVAGPTFVVQNWTLRNDLVFYPQVDVFDRSAGVVKKVPYGTVFTTILDVARFIRDYMRWLDAEGWSFEAVEPVDGSVTNYLSITRQFLEWTQIKYVPGNFIALAPGAVNLRFNADHGQAYSLLNSSGAAGLLDRKGRPMSARTVNITREAGSISIDSLRHDLAMARVSLGEIEHVMLISNTTIFNDLIYQPLYDIRVDRLYIIGNRVAGWTGRRDAQGYIIVDNDLLPSFAKAEDNVRHAFDIEGSEDPRLRQYARHVIGYQSRSYLDNLLVDDTEQFEFYQGMIKEKGTVAAFSRLARSRLIEHNTDIAFLEEWALRLNRYGAVEKDQTFSFNLRRQDLRDSVQRVDLGVESSGTAIGLPSGDSRWIELPSTANIFSTVNPIPAQQAGFGVPRFAFNPFDNPLLLSVRNFVAYTNAGYVRLGEANLEAFTTGKLPALYDQSKSTASYIRYGSKIWLYDRGDGNFDVLKAFYAGDASNALVRIETIAEDSSLGAGYARLTFSLPHYLGTADVGLHVLLGGLTGTTIDMEGFTQIVRVDSSTSIVVDTPAMSGYDYSTAGILGYNSPPFFVLRSLHFANLTSAKSFWSRFIPDNGDLIYVDDAGAGAWVVYRWNEAGHTWLSYREQPQKIDSTTLINPIIYSQKTARDSDGTTAKPVALDNITVLDPIAGLLPGEAMREISYAVDYDPAVYENNTANSWGAPQQGQLWWDLSTVRYLVAETDVLYLHDDQQRTNSEIAYRQAVWGAAAPGSSFDVYEWTRSTEYPADYDGDGVVIGASNPKYVVVEEYDPQQQSTVVVYYYWVAGRTAVPKNSGRSVGALAVATTLANPRTNDLPWIAPISANSFVLCNIEQYVGDDDTALEISVRDNAISGLPHSEWQIVGKNDESSAIPEPLWKALRSSLVGFDDQGQSIPAPDLQQAEQIGYGPGRTLFAGGRAGMLAARRTFVQTANAILYQAPIAVRRPAVLTTLAQISPTFAQLVWRSTDNRLSYTVPPRGSFNFAVVGREQRDGLLRQALFEKLRGYNLWDSAGWENLGWESATMSDPDVSDVRLLVINPNGDTPGWTVYQIDPAKALVSDDPDDWLVVAKQYDLTASSYADMLLDSPKVGDRVLVLSDENASGFWTTWLYQPASRSANSDGFVQVGMQTYRVSDFYSLVDWYSGDFSADRRPNVQYPTVIARNTAEGVNPSNKVVQVDNLGDGRWAWTEWDGSAWNLVACQNGTVLLSNDFFDNSKRVFGFDRSTDPGLVSSRDGSLELQVLVDLLRTSIFSPQEVKQLWFSMLHFMHVQQDEIDWAFKTSFLSIEGFNDVLKQSPVANLDNTENLLSYVEEIKPYRVRTRQYTRTVSPDRDDVGLHVTDFDLPVYYDDVAQKWRRLSTVTDGSVLNQLPYSDWFANYLKTSTDPSSSNFNPVRRFEITIQFDRIDPGSEPLDQAGSALQRLEALYVSRDGLENLESLVADNSSNAILHGDGGEVVLDGNHSSSLIVHGNFRAQKAQELAVAGMDESLVLTVHQTATVGAPYQIERFSQRKAAKIKIDCVLIPADTVSVLVYLDGLRAAADAYVVDLAAHCVTVTSPTPRPKTIMVHTIGVGGTTLISEQRAFEGDGTKQTFDLNRSVSGYLEVYRSNALVDSSEYTVLGSALSFATAPSSRESIVVVSRAYGDQQSTDTATRAVRQTHQVSGAVYTVGEPTSVAPGPEHVGTLCEVNGARLRHPFTRYATFDAVSRSTSFTQVASMANLKIWFDGQPYEGIVEQLPVQNPVLFPSSYVGKYDSAGWDDEMLYDVEGDVVLVQDDLLANNPERQGAMIACAYENHEFDISGNKLTLFRDLSPTDLLETTTFHNGSLLNMQVNSFNASADGLYRVPRTPGDAYLTVVDGLTKTRGLDYEVRTLAPGFDLGANDEDGFDIANPVRYVVMNQSGASERLDITCFAGRFASDEFVWHSASNRPSRQMMGLPLQQYVPPPPPGGQWDVLPWESGIEPWDHPTVATEGMMAAQTAQSSLGPRDLFAMKGTYDMTTWRPADLGRVVDNVEVETTTICVQLNPLGIDPDEMNPHAYALPSEGSVGVVWIDDERIEYTACEIVDGVASLSGLRRATHGTSLGGEQRKTVTYQAQSGQRQFKLTDDSLTPDNLISKIEVAKINNGQRTPMRANLHYTLSLNGDAVTVDFAVAPNSTVVLSHTSGFYHPAGSYCQTDNVGILLPAEE